MVVIGDEPVPTLIFGKVAERGQPLEVVLAWCAGSKQHEKRRGFVCLVAEPVHADGWYEEEVTLPAVGERSTR